MYVRKDRSNVCMTMFVHGTGNRTVRFGYKNIILAEYGTTDSAKIISVCLLIFKI